jgi:hypothetical protein
MWSLLFFSLSAFAADGALANQADAQRQAARLYVDQANVSFADGAAAVANGFVGMHRSCSGTGAAASSPSANTAAANSPKRETASSGGGGGDSAGDAGDGSAGDGGAGSGDGGSE